MAKTIADRHIFGNELCEIGKTRKDFVVLNADTKACNLEKFQEKFPDRAFTIGIAEQDMVATAAGMATCGDKVFLSTFAVFATMRACEQVRTFVCHTNANVTILGTHTGLQVGGDGATHAPALRRRLRKGPGPRGCGFQGTAVCPPAQECGAGFL